MTENLLCGTLRGHRAHLASGEPSCNRCEDAAAAAAIERVAAAMPWPGDRVKLSLLMERRRELATLPLVGPRLASALAENI